MIGTRGVSETLCDGPSPPIGAIFVVAVIALPCNKTVRGKTGPIELVPTTTYELSVSTGRYHGMTEIRTGHVVASTIPFNAHPAFRTRSDNPFSFLLFSLDALLRLQSSLCWYVVLDACHVHVPWHPMGEAASVATIRALNGRRSIFEFAQLARSTVWAQTRAVIWHYLHKTH